MFCSICGPMVQGLLRVILIKPLVKWIVIADAFLLKLIYHIIPFVRALRHYIPKLLLKSRKELFPVNRELGEN